ncbi:MAG: sugar phosphate isomerase/epimerase [Parafilimonas sp.]
MKARAIILFASFFISFQILHAQKIGLQLYSLRAQFKTDVAGTLAEIKSWGITEIEGGGTYNLPADEYKRLLAQNNLKMISVGADFDELSTNPQKAIDEAKSFGAKYIVCFWIPHSGDDFTIDDMKKAVDVFNTAGKLIQENGLSLCYHPHGYEFRPYESGTLFDYLVQHTDAKYFNFEMDVFWVKQPGQDPVALLQKYPKRFVMLHLKDRKTGTEDSQNGQADEESNVVLGQGDVNIAAIMKEAKKIGIKHYFIEDESSRSVEQIPESLAYLHQLK